MPSRNILKDNVPESYYHVYARGVSKRQIFLDSRDYAYLEKLFARYLSVNPTQSKEGLAYPHYHGVVDLLAYCLMGNHFHLLIYQKEQDMMSKLMRSILTSYSRYFNLRHKRSGPLFESRYKAARVDQKSYLQHISRYIHLNPRYWKRYQHSSLKFYRQAPPEWLTPASVLELFTSSEDYMTFLEDYEEHKAMLDEVKQSLVQL
ncbi:MAG TPA: transposase [Candidatus Limnocylindria bacterium]|nr:transposase [Candidatus Limnocylindria bacterium]